MRKQDTEQERKQELKNKNNLELIVDTAQNGILAGIKLEVGTLIAVSTAGCETRTLEDGMEKLKKSTKGCHEIGLRLGKAYFRDIPKKN
ncbi:MAG: hypothetical protein AAF378_25630 [Cyanobacteria bacterium P01_A01_bin.84]